MTGNIYLANHTWRHRFEIGIQHIGGQVRNGHTDRARLGQGMLRPNVTVSDVNRGFSDAVHVDQRWTLVVHLFPPPLERGWIQGRTTKDDPAQADIGKMQAGVDGMLGQHLE